MYEEMTYDKILEDILSRIDDTYDKREGSMLYTAVAPAALEIARMYDALNVILTESFGDTASREYLERRCAERGIIPKEATKCQKIMQCTAMKFYTIDTLDIKEGSRFTCGTLVFYVVKRLDNLDSETSQYLIECETAGSEANNQTGRLIPVLYIEGLKTAIMGRIIVPGEDDEDDETLRARYLSNLSTQGFGGNKRDYINKVSSLSGVSGCKVLTASEFNGGGTVKIIIIASDYRAPSADLVSVIQNQIDPISNAGEGYGIAPIGHHVTVAACDEKLIDVSLSVVTNGSAVENNTITQAINDYFLSLNKAWSKSDNIVVRTSYIQSAVLECSSNIVDVSDVKINGSESNLILDKSEIAVIGEVTIGE